MHSSRELPSSIRMRNRWSGKASRAYAMRQTCTKIAAVTPTRQRNARGLHAYTGRWKGRATGSWGAQLQLAL